VLFQTADGARQAFNALSGEIHASVAGTLADDSPYARYSSAQVKTCHLGGYLGGMAGAFALRGGGMWAWSDIDTSRAVVFPGFYERQKAGYHADTGQLFGEAAYPMQVWGGRGRRAVCGTRLRLGQYRQFPRARR